MHFEKKFVALAVAGVLSGGVASGSFAGVDIPTGTGGPLYYAGEILIGTAGQTLTIPAATGVANTVLGATPSLITSAPVLRFDLSNGARFATSPALTVAAVTCSGALSTAPIASAAYPNLATPNQSFAVFSLVAGNALSCPYASGVGATLGGAVVATSAFNVAMVSQTSVGLTYGMYNDQTAALAQTGVLKQYSANYIAFAPALGLTVVQSTNTADVQAGYLKFVNGATSAVLGNVALGFNTGVLGIDGNSVAYSQIVNSTSSKLIFTGDFSARGAVAYNAANITNVNDSGATVVAADPVGSLVGAFTYAVGGTKPIEKSVYTVAYAPVSANSLLYQVNTVTNTLGEVRRNGTTLVAPLVQVPSSASPSRLILNNTGAVDYTYAVTPLAETGATVVLTDAALGGTVKANSSLVVDLVGKVTVTNSPSGALRTGLKVTSTAPIGKMTGYYILLNSNGVVSNFTLKEVD